MKQRIADKTIFERSKFHANRQFKEILRKERLPFFPKLIDIYIQIILPTQREKNAHTRASVVHPSTQNPSVPPY